MPQTSVQKCKAVIYNSVVKSQKHIGLMYQNLIRIVSVNLSCDYIIQILVVLNEFKETEMDEIGQQNTVTIFPYLQLLSKIYSYQIIFKDSKNVFITIYRNNILFCCVDIDNKTFYYLQCKHRIDPCQLMFHLFSDVNTICLSYYLNLNFELCSKTEV